VEFPAQMLSSTFEEKNWMKICLFHSTKLLWLNFRKKMGLVEAPFKVTNQAKSSLV